ncbi:sensor histidine kinase [Paraflavisolibacter sp. H34]|uniref:sensor histidine kinase n=1 Tax=Huijunlia imazamoxiresistens TaxID=3127457 RepID=UPI00301AF840
MLKTTGHVAGWILFFSLVVAFVAAGPVGAGWRQVWSPSYLLFYLVYLFLFYVHLGFLFPQLFLRKRYVAYFLTLVLLAGALFYLKPFEHLMMQPSRAFAGRPPAPPGPGPRGVPFPRQGHRIDIISLILFFVTTSVGAALQFVDQWRRTERRADRAETDKAQAELSFLKAQINPHFLFNTLNNIYALALAKSDHAAPAILQLSHIMRYVTDEVRQDYVPLESELDCIRNYINLQRLRLTGKVRIDFEVTGNPAGRSIAPLVLMTFIENVFKYGISGHEPSVITIRLEAGEAALDFFCRNRIFPATTGERSGIGLENTRKRLAHLYPAAHALDIRSENGFFTVHLQLPF